MSKFIKFPLKITFLTELGPVCSSRWHGALFTAICFAIYSIVFLPFHKRLGIEASVLSILPVMAAGWCLGVWGGLLASIGAFLVNTFLFNLVGIPGWDAVITHGGGPGSSALFIIGGVVGFLSNLNNQLAWEIRERKLVERALLSSEERYRSLVDNAPVGVYQTNLDGTVLFVNAELAHILNYSSPAELIGTPVTEHYADPQDRTRFLEILKEKKQIRNYEIKFRTRDGRTLIILASAVLEGDVISGMILDITGRVQAIQALEQRATELQTLYQTSLDINSHADLESLLPIIVERAATLLGVESGGLYLLQPDGQSIKMVVSHNSPEQEIGYKLNLGEGLAGKVAEIAEVVMIEDYKEWQARLTVYDNSPLRRVLGIPLKVKDETIGVLTLADRNKSGPYLKEQINLMSLFADQVALAIKNAHLLKQERTRARELATLYETTKAIISDLDLDSVLHTVVEIMAQISGSDGCALSVLHPEHDVVETLVDYREKHPEIIDPKGRMYSLSDFPATWQVLTTRQPLAINFREDNADPAELAFMAKNKATALLMLPIISHNQVTGLVELYDETEKERVFTEEEILLLQSLTSHAAIAIENAQLFKDAQRRLRQSIALREIDKVIVESLDLTTVVKTVLKHTIIELGVDAADVLLYDETDGLLKFELGSGFHTDALKHTSLPLGEGYAGRAALTRQTIYITDLQNRQTDFLRSPSFHLEGFVTYFGVPLIAKDKVMGVLEIFHRTPMKPDNEWRNFMKSLAGQIAIAIDSANLYKNLQQSNLELFRAYDATIEGWSRALDLRDKETEGHTRRVTELTVRLAQKMGFGEEKIIHIRRGALLHDIGKMGVPDRVLLKPDQLTDEEWVLMRRHPDFAYDMLRPIEYLKPALDIPCSHHEKWDGTGYPKGLKGEEIPFAARIFAVIDVFDALTSDRPYRPAWSKNKALEFIRDQSGSHFDPKVVEAFLRMMKVEI